LKMPPRRKSAPAGRVYKSSIPLQQTTLLKPKKRIKSYGKQSTRRAKEDSTLTQIGFIKLKDRPEEEDEDEDGLKESDYEEAAKKRKTKRRRTAGDQPSGTPSWHTQTITQLDWSFSTNNGEEQEAEHDVEERSIYEVPSSSPSLPHGTAVQRLPRPVAVGPRKESPILGDSREGSPILGKSREGSPVTDMPPPRTPRRILRQEIPSSQSPATPFSIPSRRSTRQQSPLKEKSVNVAIPFNPGRTPQDSSKERPKLKIEDTYESGISDNPISQTGDVASSPDKRPSPAKSVRFALPEEEEEEEDDDGSPTSPSIKKELTPYPSQLASQPKVKFEILDSDDEDEDDFEEEIPTDLILDQARDPASISKEQDDEDENGLEEEMTSGRRLDQANHPASISQEQDHENETYYGDIGKETQFEADRIVSSVSERAPSSTPEHTGEAEHSATGETQIGETQRLSTQHLNVMAPRTENSDIFISIHPQHVTNIVNRTKNHEFRTWAIPPSVSRMWIYETKPVATLKYMAKISAAKKPGGILDQDGLGNADFDAKPRDKNYAYEILQLYELADPVPLARIVSNGWIKSAPQRFAWVGPAVADELVANLKPPLFTDMSSSLITDTQEVEEQLLNAISQFTSPVLPQHPRSSQLFAEKTDSMPPPSSIDHNTSRKLSSPPGLSQAETVDLSQALMTGNPTQEEEEEVIWESPARPVPSSTPQRLPTPRAAASDSHGPESIVPYSMSSSQFLSRSQLLPESLLNEDVPGPPRFVHDSESEDDEL
jgi:hypothetical protein